MPRIRGPGSLLPTLLLVFSGYLLLAMGAVWLSRQPGSIATLWYANAFAVALLWDQPLRRWPALLAAAMLADLLANLAFGDALALAASFVPPNLLEVILAAALLRVSGAALRMNESPGAFLQFIFFGALLPPMASASLGASILAWQGVGSFERGWMYWVEGAMLGAVSVLPLAVWMRQQGWWEFLGERRRRELLLYGGVVLLGTPFALLLLPFPFVYLALPLMIAAVRLTFASTALLVALASVSGGLIIALGLLETPDLEKGWRDLLIYLPLLLALLPALLLASAVEQLRKRRRELAASETRFRDAMDHSAIGMALVGLDGRWQRVNHALCEMLGYDEAELSALSFQDVTHPDDLAGDLELVREIIAGRRHSYRLEKRYLHKSGREIWGLLAVSLVRDHEGEPLYFISQIEDIDRRKRAEEREAVLARRYSVATEASGVGVWEWDLDSDRLLWDEGMYRLYGRTAGGELSYADWLAHLHPEDAARAEREVLAAREGSRRLDIEFRIRRGDGDQRVLKGHARLVCDAQGRPLRMVGTNWDVSELRQLAERLRDERERLQVTLDAIGDGVITTDLEGRVSFLNPVAERLSGWRSDEAQGLPIEQVLLLEGEDGRLVPNPVRDCLEQGSAASLQGLASLRHPAGGTIALRGQAAPMRAGDGTLLGSVLVLTDVSEARAMQKHLRYAATHDALTGLLNRSAFEDALAESCRDVLQNDGNSVLCFIDLDRFKQVNDSAGHAAGDELLRQLARLMQAQVRAGDQLARLGGDEFALILRSCPLPQAEMLAARLIAQIQDLALTWEGQEFHVGASVGIACIHSANAQPAELLKQADTACYRAKHAGRGQFAVEHR
ncbi:PAS domain S-box protein [Pseudomonas resinovorans]|uniref:PAS domain S-box protein n=1 Tax=Metapseudomonas resinovorans TaxID=53412 RepID=A0ABT4Y541_METRE|nr:PAS domain S-box protein [Pseudomonas resinovorans]MDA8483700.1 PAS domain S-box protein [Pseudomonas resinovorans]